MKDRKHLFISWLERKVPAWGKILAAVILILTSFYTLNDTVMNYVVLPTKLQAVEKKVESQDILLRFLVCRALERDADRETGACTYILRHTPLYEEFRHIIPDTVEDY